MISAGGKDGGESEVLLLQAEDLHRHHRNHAGKVPGVTLKYLR